MVFLSFITVMLINGATPGVTGLLLYGFGFLACTNPISTAILSEVMLLTQNNVFFGTMTVGSGASVPIISPWIVYTILYGIVSIVLLRLTVRRVRRIEV
jgi:hypothetical protein